MSAVTTSWSLSSNLQCLFIVSCSGRVYLLDRLRALSLCRIKIFTFALKLKYYKKSNVEIWSVYLLEVGLIWERKIRVLTLGTVGRPVIGSASNGSTTTTWLCFKFVFSNATLSRAPSTSWITWTSIHSRDSKWCRRFSFCCFSWIPALGSVYFLLCFSLMNVGLVAFVSSLQLSGLLFAAWIRLRPGFDSEPPLTINWTKSLWQTEFYVACISLCWFFCLFVSLVLKSQHEGEKLDSCSFKNFYSA